MKILILSVDEFGLQGRENHPEKSDEGKTATVFLAFSEAYLGLRPLADDEIKKNPLFLKDPSFHLIVFYEALTQDGIHRTFADYEVEEISEDNSSPNDSWGEGGGDYSGSGAP